MKLPIKIKFRNMEFSPFVQQRAYYFMNKLQRYFKHIISCQVVIEANHHHQQKGNIYHVCIDLTLPHTELVVSREPIKNHSHENVYVALRDAFDAMKRQLCNYSAKRRGKVKHHEQQPVGRVLEICPLADYGYIETADGREVRFTSHSVIDYPFANLEIGDQVRFIALNKFEEPVASTVRMQHKRVVNR